MNNEEIHSFYSSPVLLGRSNQGGQDGRGT